jgi:hypothetical protein
MPKPKAEVRRFDVFAEYNRQKAMADGMPADQAKGYGLWLAKVVAARRFRPATIESPSRAEAETEKPARKRKWRTLSGKPQTAKLFDKEIVNRMGGEFYNEVFVPAIRKALQRGKSYAAIRDTIRSRWTPSE